MYVYGVTDNCIWWVVGVLCVYICDCVCICLVFSGPSVRFRFSFGVMQDSASIGFGAGRSQLERYLEERQQGFHKRRIVAFR